MAWFYKLVVDVVVVTVLPAAVAFVSKAIVILCWCVVVISLALHSWYYFNVDFVCLVYYFCMCFCFISNTIFNTNTFVNAWFWHSHWFFQWCTMIDWFFSPFSKIKTSFFPILSTWLLISFRFMFFIFQTIEAKRKKLNIMWLRHSNAFIAITITNIHLLNSDLIEFRSHCVKTNR